VRLVDVSQLAILGQVYVTTPTLQELMNREIPVSWHSFGGWFIGHTVGTGHKNVEIRTAQYRTSFDPQACLRLAKSMVTAKIQNQRTFLRRNWKGGAAASHLLMAFIMICAGYSGRRASANCWESKDRLLPVISVISRR
jgi:CRISPR-associated protein Cas1